MGFDGSHRLVPVRTRPGGGAGALEAWRCFQPYGGEGQSYGWSTLSLIPEGCLAEAVELLADIRGRLPHYPGEWETRLNLEQNAWIVVNAEKYCRTMVRGGAES